MHTLPNLKSSRNGWNPERSSYLPTDIPTLSLDASVDLSTFSQPTKELQPTKYAQASIPKSSLSAPTSICLEQWKPQMNLRPVDSMPKSSCSFTIPSLPLYEMRISNPFVTFYAETPKKTEGVLFQGLRLV